MKLPTIAPLTHREAKAARRALPYMREGLEMMPADSANRPFAAASVEELEAALSEYEARSWVARRVPQPAGHKTPLRRWFLEIQGYTEGILADLKVDDHTS